MIKILSVGVFSFLIIVSMAVYFLLWPLSFLPARDAIGTKVDYFFNGTTYQYFDSGKGKNIVLLSASAGRGASDFNELVTELNVAGFRTLAVEAPGIGGTELFRNHDLYDLADMLRAVLSAHKAATDDNSADQSLQVHVIGHAFGSLVARAYASKYPDHVDKIVLIAAGSNKSLDHRTNKALRKSFDPTLIRRKRLEKLRYAFFADGNIIPKHWTVGWHYKTAQMQDDAIAAMTDEEWQNADGKPMLVLQAENDRVAPAEIAGKLLKTKNPDRVELVIIPQAGHAMLPEQPDLIAREILTYFSSYPSVK